MITGGLPMKGICQSCGKEGVICDICKLCGGCHSGKFHEFPDFTNEGDSLVELGAGVATDGGEEDDEDG